MLKNAPFLITIANCVAPQVAFPAADLQEALALLLKGEHLRKRVPPRRTVDAETQTDFYEVVSACFPSSEPSTVKNVIATHKKESGSA